MTESGKMKAMADEIKRLKELVQQLASEKADNSGEIESLAQRRRDAAFEKHWADFYAWKAEQQAVYDAIIESPGPVVPHTFKRPTPAPDPGPTADSIADELISRGLTDMEFEIEFARALKVHGLESR